MGLLNNLDINSTTQTFPTLILGSTFVLLDLLLHSPEIDTLNPIHDGQVLQHCLFMRNYRTKRVTVIFWTFL